MNIYVFQTLRNWFLVLNSIVIIAQGSEAKLRFKYFMLPGIVALCLSMAQYYPEFLSRLMDYIDGWSRRTTYDQAVSCAFSVYLHSYGFMYISNCACLWECLYAYLWSVFVHDILFVQSLDLLVNAYRGESICIEKSISHANVQIAAHFISLREETLRTEGGGVSLSVAEANIMPSYLVGLMSEWKALSETGSLEGGSGEVVEWYKVSIGERLLNTIAKSRSEVEEKFGKMLKKYKGINRVDLFRSKGQIDVLIKREFKKRSELLGDELKLVSWLDSRHLLLIRKFEVFANLRMCLDK